MENRTDSKSRRTGKWRTGGPSVWDVSAYFNDALDNQGPLSNLTIPSYTRLDTGLIWKLREGFSLSLVGQNLLKDHHMEFEDVNGSMQSGQIKRSAYAELVWQ